VHRDTVLVLNSQAGTLKTKKRKRKSHLSTPCLPNGVTSMPYDADEAECLLRRHPPQIGRFGVARPSAVLLLVVITFVNCVSSEEIFWGGVFSRKLNCTRQAIHISQVITSLPGSDLVSKPHLPE